MLTLTFECEMHALQVLEWTPEAPFENMRYVRITARESPSWIAWREIEVVAE